MCRGIYLRPGEWLNTLRELAGRLPDRTVQGRRVYQVQSGWGHLLPGERTPERDRRRGRRCLLVATLRPRECDILSVLRDRGPQTAADLARALGLARLRARRRGPAVDLPRWARPPKIQRWRRRDGLLRRLARRGLVVCVGRIALGPKRWPRVWALSDLAAAGTGDEIPPPRGKFSGDAAARG